MIIIFLVFSFQKYHDLILFIFAYFFYPLENIIGGLVVFIYQKYSIRKKEKTQYFGIKLIHNKNEVARDGKVKKILLVFFAAYFNFYRFLVGAFTSNDYITTSMVQKLTTIQIIISTIICIYSFEFKIKKHHKISLIIIGIFLFLSISTDIIYI